MAELNFGRRLPLDRKPVGQFRVDGAEGLRKGDAFKDVVQEKVQKWMVMNMQAADEFEESNYDTH